MQEFSPAQSGKQARQRSGRAGGAERWSRLVTVAVPSSVNDVLEAKLLEAMTHASAETKARTLGPLRLRTRTGIHAGPDGVAIGPGLSTHPETVDLVQSLMKHLDRPSCAGCRRVQCAGEPCLITHRSVKFLPFSLHILAKWHVWKPEATAQSVNADRLGTASALYAGTRRLSGIKGGANRHCADRMASSQSVRLAIAGMATAGTGDVLTGMIVGLLAQGMSRRGKLRAQRRICTEGRRSCGQEPGTGRHDRQ